MKIVGIIILVMAVYVMLFDPPGDGDGYI